MSTVTLNIRVAIADGPTWTIAQTDEIGAYDVLDIVLPAGTASQLVELQPTVASRIQLLVIQSSLYGPEIQFKTNAGAADSPAISLLGPQIYGSGVATLFAVAPNSLKLSNSFAAGTPGKNARIQILIGRDPTP
ncbi:hypothetical protein [Chitinimonas naiadis]